MILMDEWMTFDDDTDGTEDSSAMRGGRKRSSRTATRRTPAGPSYGGQRSRRPPPPPEEDYDTSQGYDYGPGDNGGYAVQDSTPPPPKKGGEARFNIGSALGIIAVVMIIVGLILPWYFVDISVQSNSYDTGGRQPFVSLGGYKGFQMELPPDKNGNTTAVNKARDNITSLMDEIPLMNMCGTCTIIYLSIMIIIELFVVVRYLRDDSPKRGNKFIKHGIFVLLPIVLIIFVLPFIVSYLLSMAAGGQGDTSGASDAAMALATTVISGSTTFSPDDGTVVKLWWGFATGLWLIISGAILAIIAGIVDRVLS